ncbi:MAG: DUF1592 domain-containing protein [Planctomycetaceae bacterium]
MTAAESARDESFFVRRLYPVMKTVQCNLCHNDNGVGSETELSFPGEFATPEQVEAFGLKLMDFVDRTDPRQSLLFLKPTNREEHTGGVRIKPDSDEEQILLSWIDYLANLTDDQRRVAREKIAKAEQFTLQPLTMRRLTHSQYNHTVQDLLGDRTQPSGNFPKEDFIHGFRNQVEGQGISPLQAEAYSKAAERLALAAFRGGDHRNLLPAKEESSTPAERAAQFVRQFGLKAFRRPISDSEVELYAGLFEREAQDAGDELAGAKIVVETMLQSPHFLFRIEHGPGELFEQYGIACRLSYLIWDTMPDDDLFQAAANSELSSVDQIEAVVRRMLDDSRAKNSLDEFLSQWMRFDRVLNATRDRRRFRDFNPELAAAMVEETRLLFNYLVWNDQNFMEFFTADYTFLSSDLARIYDLPAPAEEYARVSYPADSGRAGVLGQASFLAVTSKPAETSPTERGVFVRNHFLGHEVPAPPPGVNAILPTVTEDMPMTNRQRLDLHLNSEACASCHRLIDPIGLGLEQYDAIGAFSEKMSLQFGGGYGERREQKTLELDIDTTAYIQGMENSEFNTPKELGRLLANSESCQRCIVKQFFRYTFGRQETVSDQPVIDDVLRRFRESGFRFRELIVAVVTSDLFLQKGSRQ